jgi:hypothetical protein
MLLQAVPFDKTVNHKELKMPRVELKTAYRVDIIESERGWGSKIDDTIYFDNEAEAREYCQQFNSRNTEAVAPDWYMRADYVGRVN